MQRIEITSVDDVRQLLHRRGILYRDTGAVVKTHHNGYFRAVALGLNPPMPVCIYRQYKDCKGGLTTLRSNDNIYFHDRDASNSTSVVKDGRLIEGEKFTFVPEKR